MMIRVSISILFEIQTFMSIFIGKLLLDFMIEHWTGISPQFHDMLQNMSLSVSYELTESQLKKRPKK